MKVSTKLAGGYGGLILLLAGLTVFHVAALNDTAGITQRLSGISSRLVVSTTDHRYWLDELQEYAGGYEIFPADSAYARAFRDVSARLEGSLARLKRFDLTPRERAELVQFEALWDRFRRRTRDLDAALASDDSDGGLRALEGWFRRLRRQREAMSRATRRAMENRVEEASRQATTAERVSWAGVGAAILLGAGVWVFIVRSISRSLDRLTTGTRRVAEGEFAYRLEPEGGDEFAELARDFNEMNERLGELDRLKRDFVSKVSHDLKSPLASLQETHNLLLEEVPGKLNDDQRRLLELSRESGERLSEMIENLLRVSRFEAGAERLNVERVDLRDPAVRAADRMEPAFRKRGVELRRVLPADPVPVEVDADRLEEVVDNLLSNALSFSPEGESVELQVVPTDGGGEIAVSDRGPGVPAGQKEEVFDRFFQGEHGGARTSDGGVGLGLTLCRQIVEAHGGGITVEDREGGGSRFRARLPRRTPGAGEGGRDGEG